MKYLISLILLLVLLNYTQQSDNIFSNLSEEKQQMVDISNTDDSKTEKKKLKEDELVISDLIKSNKDEKTEENKTEEKKTEEKKTEEKKTEEKKTEEKDAEPKTKKADEPTTKKAAAEPKTGKADEKKTEKAAEPTTKKADETNSLKATEPKTEKKVTEPKTEKKHLVSNEPKTSFSLNEQQIEEPKAENSFLQTDEPQTQQRQGQRQTQNDEPQTQQRQGQRQTQNDKKNLKKRNLRMGRLSNKDVYQTIVEQEKQDKEALEDLENKRKEILSNKQQIQVSYDEEKSIVQKYKTQYVTLTTEQLEYSTTLSGYQIQSMSLERTIYSYDATIQTQKTEINTITQHSLDNTEAITKIQSKIDQSNDEIKRLADQQAKEESNKKDLMAQLTSAKNSGGSFTQTTTTQQTEITETKRLREKTKQQLDEINLKIEKIKDGINKRNTKITQMTSEMQSQDNKVTEIGLKLQSYEDALLLIQAQISDMKQKICKDLPQGKSHFKEATDEIKSRKSAVSQSTVQKTVINTQKSDEQTKQDQDQNEQQSQTRNDKINKRGRGQQRYNQYQ